MKKPIFAATTLGLVAFLALSATPAQAAPFTGGGIEFSDAQNTVWTWEDWGYGKIDRLTNDVWESNSGADFFDNEEFNLFGSDNTTYSTIACPNPADLTTDISGDQILTCHFVSIDNGDGEVTASMEFRFFADLKTLRSRLTFTNETSAPIAGQVVEYYYNSFYDSQTSVYASTSAGVDDYASNFDAVPTTVTGPGDVRWVTDDRMDDEHSPVVQNAVGRLGSIVDPADDAVRGWQSGSLGNGSDDSSTYFELPTIEPGQTVEIVVMLQVWLFDADGTTPVAPMDAWQTAIGATDAAAWADTTIDSDAYVFAGIADTSKVLNWTPKPQLPNTGVDVGGFAGLAFSLLLAGVAVVVVRRRARA